MEKKYVSENVRKDSSIFGNRLAHSKYGEISSSLTKEDIENISKYLENPTIHDDLINCA